MVNTLAGIHHVKLPVADLDRAFEWYRSRLGYRGVMEFREQGTLMGLVMTHPAGGPDLALRLNPDLASGSAGFDFFAFGVPDEPGVHALADHFTALGDQHNGVQRTPFGWVLQGVHDPDGHEVKFYANSPDAPDLSSGPHVRES